MAIEIGNCKHAQTQPAAFILLYSSQAQSSAALNAWLSLGGPSSDHPNVLEWEYELSACKICTWKVLSGMRRWILDPGGMASRNSGGVTQLPAGRSTCVRVECVSEECLSRSNSQPSWFAPSRASSASWVSGFCSMSYRGTKMAHTGGYMFTTHPQNIVYLYIYI